MWVWSLQHWPVSLSNHLAHRNLWKLNEVLLDSSQFIVKYLGAPQYQSVTVMESVQWPLLEKSHIPCPTVLGQVLLRRLGSVAFHTSAAYQLTSASVQQDSLPLRLPFRFTSSFPLVHVFFFLTSVPFLHFLDYSPDVCQSTMAHYAVISLLGVLLTDR